MEIVLIWFVGAIAVGVGASSRGRSGFGWFILSLLISPLLTLILLLVMPNLAEKAAAEATKPNADTHVKCPDCAELVLKEAKVCKHCGCKLVPQA